MNTPAPRPDPVTHHKRPAASTTPLHSTGEPETGPAGDRLAYSVGEAARLTGLSRDLLYDQMRRGNLLYLKVGRRRVITRQHLQQFLDITETPATHQTGRARS